MSWQRIKCAVFGHAWSMPMWASHPRHCRSCGAISEGVKYTPAPPMPECKPPRPELPEVITVSAGDTIMLTCYQIHNRAQAVSFRQSILDQLPEGCKVVVIYGGAKVEAVLRAKPVIPQPQPERNRGPIPNIPMPKQGTSA